MGAWGAKNRLLIFPNLGHTSNNENVKENLRMGGGAFLLTLSVMAGVLLIRPVQNNQNNTRVVNAATEVINGVTYETVYLTGDQGENATIFGANTDKNKNYRYVLTADYDARYHSGGRWENRFSLVGQRVIFDLNGYTYYANGWETVNGSNRFSYLTPACDTFELTDSSAAQSGMLGGNGHHIHLGSVKNLIITGGGGNLGIVAASGIPDVKIVFKGGWYSNIGWNFALAKESFAVAPYLIATYDGTGRPQSIKPYDDYAVAESNLVSGVYNYEFGNGWGLRVTDLINYVAPNDKTHYLWARNADGEYAYLHIQYVDGGWVQVS